MSKPLSTSDFRAIRSILEPEDFALSEGPERRPSDLIDKEIWHGIMDLPDDVAIRTSNHNGKDIKIMYELWSSWIDAIGETEDLLYIPMLDSVDDYQASVFNILHGYYRQSFDSLRSALELTTIATECQLRNKVTEFAQWRAGTVEMSLGGACDGIATASRARTIEIYLKNKLEDNLFSQRNRVRNMNGGWIRRLFGDLSNFAHSRPGYTNGDLWNSNGPVYDQNAFNKSYSYYLNTMSACYILVKLARINFKLPEVASKMFLSNDLIISVIAQESFKNLF